VPDLQKVDLKSAALLTLDCQKGIVGFVPGSEKIFPLASKVVKASRLAHIPVIHIGIGFRGGYPEVHPRHPMFGMIRQTGRFILGSDSAAFHESVAPEKDEIIIVKHRVSAFSGNDLEMILRSQEITTLILFGLSTSGIVLSTIRQASDMDFQCVIVKDCCFDQDEEVHRVLTEKVFSRQARVVTADMIIKEMESLGQKN